MGRRGPTPTPTKILKLRGSYAANHRAGEPEPQPERSRWPIWLSRDAKLIWTDITKRLTTVGLMTVLDRNTLAIYCQLYARWKLCEKRIQEHGLYLPLMDDKGQVVGYKERPEVYRAQKLAMDVARLGAKFGLSPADRAMMAGSLDQSAPSPQGKERYFDVG